MVDMIAKEGIGDLLAEGTKLAAQKLGGNAMKYSIQVKGQELPMHEPRLKRALGVGYAVSPTGADHCHNLHDPSITTNPEPYRPFGFLEPLPLEDMGPKKVQALIYRQSLIAMMNSIGFCMFYLFQSKCTPNSLADIVRAVTGWDIPSRAGKYGEKGVNNGPDVQY
jgi:aldehyde:ferredoxin oxidoreductase